MKVLKLILVFLLIVVGKTEIVRERVWNIKKTFDFSHNTKEGINYEASALEEPLQNINKTSNGVLVTGDCAFQITGDLHDPAPLFTTHGNFEWLIPNKNGIMEIKNGQKIDMYCTDSFSKPFENNSTITAQCLQGKYFLVNGTIFPLSSFSCLGWPTYTARRTGRKCNGGTDLLKVGFEVSSGFLRTMDICHDELNEVTRYVQYTLYPATDSHQRNVTRPKFIENGFYDGKNLSNLYYKKQQNDTFSKILNKDASTYFNFSDTIYLSRGHLAAKADFIFGAQQIATFLYVNVAPQWLSFNSGNWERIESGLRKYAFKNNLILECYSGTWGISKLPDVNGEERELYLAFDVNNKGLIPVPKIYFRVVIERTTRQGIVLVGVNNPHATLEQIKEEYILCEDIGGAIDWLNWQRESLYFGYSYACSVPDFLRTVKDLPIEKLDTNGVLGMN